MTTRRGNDFQHIVDTHCFNKQPQKRWLSTICYTVKATMSIFGTEQEFVINASMETIGRYFNDRLRTIFAGVAKRPGVLRNSTNNPLYLLCFAAERPTLLVVRSRSELSAAQAGAARAPHRSRTKAGDRKSVWRYPAICRRPQSRHPSRAIGACHHIYLYPQIYSLGDGNISNRRKWLSFKQALTFSVPFPHTRRKGAYRGP